MSLQALLVTPLPPLETGLATFAGRIVASTRGRVRWTVAYTDGGRPIPGCTCIPLAELAEGDLPGSRLFQLGNSIHCAQVFQALEKWGGAAVFHEVNFHHVLRHIADVTGNWAEYRRHMAFEYGPDARRALRTMDKRAKSREEYDRRLRQYPLFRRVVSWCGSLSCLNRYAMKTLSLAAPDRPVTILGHPLDPLPGSLPASPVFPGGVVVAGVAGGFGYGRGWEHAIEAVARLRRKREAVLVAAGAGWPDPGLPWVTVTGRLPEPEYQATIRAFNVAFDLREGSCGETSGSLLELLRAGIPTIVSDTGAFTEIPSGAVLRVPSDLLPDSAGEALSWLLEHPDVPGALASQAVLYTKSQGDIEVFGELVSSLLETSMTTGRKGGACSGGRPFS